jgi:hypothetical protein
MIHTTSYRQKRKYDIIYRQFKININRTQTRAVIYAHPPETSKHAATTPATIEISPPIRSSYNHIDTVLALRRGHMSLLYHIQLTPGHDDTSKTWCE